jgi:hypothetical protein
MNSVVAGQIKEIGPGYIVLGPQVRIEVPDGLWASVADCQVGQSLSIVLVGGHDGTRMVARSIRRNDARLRQPQQ